MGKVEEEDILCLTDQDLIRIDSTYLNDQIKHVYLHTDRISRDEQMRNVEYSILLVMSELSTVRCNHALGLWIAGTRASSVDGELPWRSSGRATAVASTPGSRAQAATEGGFLGLRHKTKEADGG